MAATGAAPFLPASRSVAALAAAAAACAGCELAGPATATVFSAGPPSARLALVGEQPGDAEDRVGRPFVGPAGRLLDRALADAGLDRAEAYVTNAVKHFRFRRDTPGGRRLHVTPDLEHLAACRPWLVAELAAVHPTVVVLLGASAGRALLGPDFRVGRSRGRLMARPVAADEPARERGGWVLATVHPSAVLRAQDSDAAYAGLVADLRLAAAAADPAAYGSATVRES